MPVGENSGDRLRHHLLLATVAVAARYLAQ